MNYTTVATVATIENNFFALSQKNQAAIIRLTFLNSLNGHDGSIVQ